MMLLLAAPAYPFSGPLRIREQLAGIQLSTRFKAVKLGEPRAEHKPGLGDREHLPVPLGDRQRVLYPYKWKFP